jgi:cobaltochelatase CobT
MSSASGTGQLKISLADWSEPACQAALAALMDGMRSNDDAAKLEVSFTAGGRELAHPEFFAALVATGFDVSHAYGFLAGIYLDGPWSFDRPAEAARARGWRHELARAAVATVGLPDEGMISLLLSTGQAGSFQDKLAGAAAGEFADGSARMREKFRDEIILNLHEKQGWNTVASIARGVQRSLCECDGNPAWIRPGLLDSASRLLTVSDFVQLVSDQASNLPWRRSGCESWTPGSYVGLFCESLNLKNAWQRDVVLLLKHKYSLYHVYCRDFDVEIEADKLDTVLVAKPSLDRTGMSAEQLAEIRRDLAARQADRDSAVRAAAARIGAAISQRVLDDTIVSLLIDHSGSMRGLPVLFAATAAMTASGLLDGIGIKQEVLGFTTVRWKGGLSREQWLRDGKPAHPGRLNDLLHIVYCSAGERLQARHCETMQRVELLKENIDGEAVAWAVRRLYRCRERHKYLIVLSDGAPVDDSTMHENRDAYLDRHLRSVIRESRSVCLAAIGLNFRVERYYARSITVAAPEELDGAVLRIIEQLLCPAPPARQAPV